MQLAPRLSSTPSATLAALQDNDYKTHYREQLEAVGKRLQILRRRPTFSAFVNERLNATFTSSAGSLEASRIFISNDSTDLPVAQPSNNATGLLPSLMDAGIKRIVGQQSALFASPQTRFTLGRDAQDDEDLPSSLTPTAFSVFLDDLAGSLDSAYKTRLDAFWNEAVSATDPRSVKQLVIASRSDQLRLEAILLRADGTLNSNGVLLIEEFIAYPDAKARHSRPRRPAAYTVVLKGEGAAPDLSLHGALVLTVRDQSYSVSEASPPDAAPKVRPIAVDADVGFVILFTPNRGLEAFPSLESLDKELHRRLNTDNEFDSLFELLADKDVESATDIRDKAQVTGCFDYKEVLGPIVSVSVSSQYEKLIHDFKFMVAHYQQRGIHADISQLPASLNLTTDMERLFGVRGVMLARETKRSKAELEQFLSAASEPDKQAWATAVREYLSELQNAQAGDGLPSISQFGDHDALLAYSDERLAQALEDEYGIDESPSDIKVTIRRPNPAPGIYFPGARPNPQVGQSHYSIETKSLAELALENVDYLDEVFVAKSRLSLHGKPFTQLTTQQVKDLVRDTDIGGSYIDFLKRHLQTSAEAKNLKQDFVNVMLKQLRVDAIEAKISRDYLPDPQDRGYHLVENVLDHPTETAQRATFEGHKVTVAALYVRDIHVLGVLAFISSSPKINVVVLYTPRAKDGRVFREYTGMTQLLEQFVNNTAWHDYLYERMDGGTLPRMRSTFKRGIFREEVSLSPIRGNFLERTYDWETRAAIVRADRRTTSTHESNVRSAWTVVEGLVEVALAVFPVKVTFVIGLVRSAMALSAALDALQNDDSIGATHEFVKAFTHLVGALVDGAVGVAPVRFTPSRVNGLPRSMALRAAPKDVTPLSGWESQGIYTRAGKGSTPGQHFLKEKDQWYKVAYDETSGTGTWRLKKPRQTGEHAYHQPPISQNALNEWVIRSPHYGLRGGYHSRMACDDLTRFYPDLDTLQAARVLDSFEFPVGRERAMELRFVRHLGRNSLESQAIGLRDIPREFRQYLNPATTLDQVRLRLQGIEPSAYAVPVALPAARPSVIVTNHWKSWGQQIQAGLLNKVQHTYGVFEYKPVFTAEAGWSLVEGTFIKLNDRFYRTTFDVRWYDTTVAIRNSNVSYGDFDSFELMLRNNPSEQPMIATYNRATAAWEVLERRPFEKKIAAYVEDAFPEMTPSSRTQVARAVFNRYQKDFKFVDMLRVWRTGQTHVADPLSLLELTRRTRGANRRLHIGRAHRGTQPTVWRRLDFEPDSFHPHYHQAVTRQGPVTLRALMVEVMRRVTRAEFLESTSDGTALLFRRVGDDMLYCLHPVDVTEPFITARVEGFAVPRDFFSFRNSRALVESALGENKLINLVGGVQHNRHGVQPPQLFIIKLDAFAS
ncbi:dermonecrotic toxin domain-containing protein [Pseudomonas sp. MF7453]|uniref:dermonecrotic toxin domain-containing protein n=1 Tax=Pseudomonas sp. MF7453 TaxID=2797539 RepID=UPI0018E891A0|nr:DUF6543 domain-containing protein [Pseudomonas sp. MF7453]MBJ2217279.1 hypothetical protein [Pseudomonas sp. MF7453]